VSESAESPIVTRACRRRRRKNDTVFFLAVPTPTTTRARVTMGDTADSNADDPLFHETGADMSRWLSRRITIEVGPDLTPVSVPAAMSDGDNWLSDNWAAFTDCESADDFAVATSAVAAVAVCCHARCAAAPRAEEFEACAGSMCAQGFTP